MRYVLLDRKLLPWVGLDAATDDLGPRDFDVLQASGKGRARSMSACEAEACTHH